MMSKLNENKKNKVTIPFNCFQALYIAAKEGMTVAKTPRENKAVPLDLSMEAIYKDEQNDGVAVYGIVEETKDFEGTFFVLFVRNPKKSGKKEAYVGFSKLCLSNFCGVKHGFNVEFVTDGSVGTREGDHLATVNFPCVEYCFQGLKTAYVDGSIQDVFGAALKVFTSDKPGKAKQATGRQSGLKILPKWDEEDSAKVMEGAVFSQLKDKDFFGKLYNLAMFCKEKEGVEAEDVYIVEATDDKTWGYGCGSGSGAKLGDGEKVSWDYITKRMSPLVFEEGRVFKKEGGMEFASGQNKLGKILTKAMALTVEMKGDYDAFLKSEKKNEEAYFWVYVGSPVDVSAFHKLCGVGEKRGAENGGGDGSARCKRACSPPGAGAGAGAGGGAAGEAGAGAGAGGGAAAGAGGGAAAGSMPYVA
jgi:hypothetical protein